MDHRQLCWLAKPFDRETLLAVVRRFVPWSGTEGACLSGDMLADFLEANRAQLVREIESRAAREEPLYVSAKERHLRVEALFGELSQALRRGSFNPPTRSRASPLEAEAEAHERELMCRELVEQTEHLVAPATLREMVIVSEWALVGERTRVREHERQLSVLLEDVDEGALLFSPDARILYANREAARVMHELTGAPMNEIIGKTGAELGVPAELGPGLPADELVAKGRAAVSSEVLVHERWRQNKFGAIYAPDGTLSIVTLVSRDIQSRRLTETRFQLLSRMSALVGSVHYEDVPQALARIPIPEVADWCIVSLVEGKEIRTSFVAQRDPGKAALRDALMRELPRFNRHPLWQEMRTGGFQLLTEVSDDLLRRLVTTDEQYRLLAEIAIRSLIVVPIVTRGQTTGILTLAYTPESGRRYGRDDPELVLELALHAAHIVENARLLKELESSEARFRVGLAGTRTAVYEQDASLRYLWYYNAWLPFSLGGKTHEEVYEPEDAAVLTAMKRRVVETGESAHEEVDLTLMGERRHFREVVDPVRDHLGKVVGVIGSGIDITEEKRVQQELRDALAFRDLMNGILGHDLRNPLGAVLLAAGALLQQPDLPVSARDKAVVIQRASGRMTEMIETLLDFTRVRAMGRLPVSPVAIDLAVLVREVADESRAAFPGSAIELDVQGDLHGEWDSARVAQTLSNLVANAIAYGDPGVPVRVSAVGEDADVLVKVNNKGTPIAPDLIPVFFEPFRRGARDRSPHGLGLGLYIVKQIVLAHGGTVDVESSAETGTTFTLRLPRKQPETTTA
jgi:signal transduction histidine kinase